MMTSHTINDLIQLLNNPDQSIRQTAKQTLMNLGKSIVPKLIQAIEDSEGHIRDETIHLLGELADERSIPTLTALLDNPDRVLVHRAVMALLAYQKDEILKLLLEKLAELPANTGMHVIKEIGSYRYYDAIDTLMELVATTNLHSYRFMAIRTLTQLNATKAKSLIAKFQNDADYFVSQSARQAMTHLATIC